MSGILLAAANACRHNSLGLPEIAINSFTALSTSGGRDCDAEAEVPLEAAVAVWPDPAAAVVVAAALAEAAPFAAVVLAAVVAGFSSSLASSLGAGFGFGAGFAF